IEYLSQNEELLQKQLEEKLKGVINASDLKEKELLKTIERLEAEKSEHLIIIANYEQEHSASIAAFQDQEEVIQKKDKQLSGKDGENSTLSEQITELKERIIQITREKNQLKEKKEQKQKQEFEISLKNAQEENDKKI